MNTIRWTSLVIFLAIMAAFFHGHRSWILVVLAAVAGIAVMLTSGAAVIFTRAFWLADDEASERLAAADVDLDRRVAIAREELRFRREVADPHWTSRLFEEGR